MLVVTANLVAGEAHAVVGAREEVRLDRVEHDVDSAGLLVGREAQVALQRPHDSAPAVVVQQVEEPGLGVGAAVLGRDVQDAKLVNESRLAVARLDEVRQELGDLGLGDVPGGRRGLWR